MVRYYRQTHNVAAATVYLFNHESGRRGSGFFVPKLVSAVLLALEGRKPPAFRTLDFYCDWGSAAEYMSMVIQAAQQAPREDYILATGKTTYAEDLVRSCFDHFGLDFDSYYEAPAERSQANYQVDTRKLERILKRVPEKGIVDLVVELVRSRS